MGAGMKSENWWLDKETILSTLDSSYMAGVTVLHGIARDNVWEYAIVRYYYMCPNLISRWREGTIIEDNHEVY